MRIKISIFNILLCTVLLLFSCQEKKETAFESLSPATTHIDFKNELEKKDQFNILYYLYYYNGGGVATGDVNNDGLVDIYFTANSKGHNKLYLNKGNFVFEDITEKAGVAGTADWSSGVTMADVNGDGFTDIYVCASSSHHGLTGHNELFINNGISPSPADGEGRGEVSFTENAEKYGLNFSGFGTQAAFFDYDRDGDLDCYLLNNSFRSVGNYDLDSTSRFTDVSAAADIYQSNLGYGLGIATGDFNNDGWDDIYIGNDFHENDYYYLNNGKGAFIESGASHFKHFSRFSMGNDAADYNNDGQLDIVTVDMLPQDEKVLKTYGSDENPDTYKYKLMGHGYQNQYSRNALQRNNGNGSSFSETALQSGVAATDWSWSPLFADFDNDGNKDLFISSGIVKRPVDMDYIRFVSDMVMKQGSRPITELDNEAIENMPDGSSHPYFYKGDGKINFTDVSSAWGTGDMKGYFNGASYADLNNDGNLDMVINCLNAAAVILKNKLPAKPSIDLVFKGNDKNTKGMGVKAWIFTGDKMQYQQLMTSRGFQSASDAKLHFGLDSIRYIDSMLIVWPNQKFQLFKNTPAKGLIEVKQAESGGHFDYNTFFPQVKSSLTDISNQVKSNWTHRENDFLDFNKQYLTPHMQSTRGPKIAVGDVNKDGLDDIFVCGAAGQAGQLMIQSVAGKFTATDTAVFAKAKQSEGVDAVFFDANKDGAPDLYVVSGGNQYDDGAPYLADHLYMNDGKGHFSEAIDALPALLKNKSCVTVADIDKDGDMDLFVGGLADAKRFGIAQSSYLLLNDGTGKFAVAGNHVIPATNLGMVTCASFADINNDGWNDLLVAGEWMGIKIFLNKNGKFTASEIAASTGLWQTLYATDVNGDGFTDILAGNWGHNSKLYAGKNGPLKLYVKDFDNNGSVEQVVAYTVDKKEYSFLAKDELERSLPVLKKYYLKYSEVAGKTVDYMFYNLFKDYTELKAETLGSCCFINNGKGNFTKAELPEALQMAPVFTFCPLTGTNNGTYLAAGNFYGVVPYEGRYDALLPSAFSFNKKLNSFQPLSGMQIAEGEVRDAKWIRYAGGKQVLIIAQNNKGLVFLKAGE